MRSIPRNLYRIEMVSITLYIIDYFYTDKNILLILGIRDDGMDDNNQGNESGECTGATNNSMQELLIDGMEWMVKCIKAIFE